MTDMHLVENKRFSNDCNTFINIIIEVSIKTIDPSKFQDIYNNIIIQSQNCQSLTKSLKSGSKIEQFKENLIHILNTETNLDIKSVKLDTSLIKSTQKLTEDFLDRYKSKFGQLTDKAFFDTSVDIRENGDRLEDLLCSLFSESINWGRIIGMVTVMKELLNNLLEKNLLNLIAEYVRVCSRYYDLNIRAWVEKNNGWEGLVAFGGNSVRLFDDIVYIGRLAAMTVGAVMAFKYIFSKI